MLNININDFQYNIKNKLTIIQACLVNKVDVPRFCFHEKLSVAGNCRMCLVEDLKQIKPLASCAIGVAPSMNIYTNTLKVKKARESVLEFLLANHPLDCPICDQGGECDLQDQSMVFGSDRGRFYEFKRSVEDKDCGPLIKTIMNRCIHCTRCVRFSNEVSGTSILGVTGRGSKMEIGFYVENIVKSELSGNIIDLCPVGALTSKPFAFTSRPWELKSYNSIDILDPMHSNIRVDIRGTKVLRILPRINESINGEWITDKIRFSYDAFRRQRLYSPTVQKDSNFVKVSWKRMFVFLKNYFLISLRDNFHINLSSYLGHLADLETIYITKKFTTMLGSSFVNSNDFSALNKFNTNFKDLGLSDICVILNMNIRLVMPIFNSRIRQLSIKENIPVYLIGCFSDFNFYFKHISISKSASLILTEGNHWLNIKLNRASSKNPIFLIGNNFSNVLIKYLINNTNVVSDNWNGLNFFSKYPGLSELGFANSATNNPNSINLLVNYDNPVSSFNSNIYLGHHGDINAQKSNIILPSLSFIEKNSTYLNIFGMLQKTKKALFHIGESRYDWHIINAISIFLKLPFSYSNKISLLKDIDDITPLLNYKQKNTVSLYFEDVSLRLYLLNYLSNYKNYYLSDSITRNSKIMSLCANSYKSKNYNFF